MKKLILLLLYQLSLCALHAQDWTDELDSVLTVLEKEEIFHGQILIAEKGRILFSKAYGKNEKGAITLQTPQSVESVTKAFTALSVLILQDRGLLNLNDKLTHYFPKLPYQQVTIRNLLNMTSGLPRFLPTLISRGDTTRLLHNDEVIKLISRYKPKANTPPGSTFFYNTDNYVLLAAIIEKISGETYADFIQKNIFNPLKMEESYVNEFNELKQGQINSSNFYSVYGDGNAYSTAEDLFLFDQALYTDQLLSHDLIRTICNPTTLNDGIESNYGFAWTVSKYDNKTESYIVGDGENSRTSIQRFIDDKKTFIYIHNFSGMNWKQVYEVVRNIWEKKEYTMPTRRTIYNIDQDLLDNYVSQYLTKNFGLLHITKENGKLYLRPDPIPGKEELVPSSDTTFYFANQGLDWEFFLDEQGTVIGLGIKGRPDTMGSKQ